MPINGDQFIKRMDSFVKATDAHVRTTELLLKRMEKFLENEDQKQAAEKKLQEKRAYVRAKDPLEDISKGIGKSNILLQDILDEMKKRKGSGDGGNGFNLKNLGLGAAALGAALGSESLMNKVLQEIAKPITKKVSEYIARTTERKLAQKGAEILAKRGAEAFGEEVIEIGGKKLIQNAAGKWIEKESGKFVTRELGDKAANEFAKRTIQKSAKGATLKTVGKGAAKIARFIPGIGFIVATPFAIDRIMKGDYVGAAMEVGSAIPGPLGWAIAAGQAAYDIWGKSDAQKQAEEGKGWFDPLYDKVKNKAIRSFNQEFVEEPKYANSVYGRIGKYNNTIEQEAQKTSLDPNMIRAIIAQESSGNENAVSPKGAKGLMQLMPGTANMVGINDSMNPEQNIHGGSLYFKSLLDHYGNDVPKAIAAYNMGPTALDRLLKRHKNGWENYLPDETKKYVPKVMGYYQAFTQGQLKQGEGTPEVSFDNSSLPDSSVSDALKGLKDLFSGKGRGSGITLSDASITKLAEKIGQNIAKFQPNTPTVFNVDSRR